MAEMTPEGSVIITPMMQYLEMQRLAKAVDKLTNALDPALQGIRDDIAHHADQIKALDGIPSRVKTNAENIEDHEDRIRGMERRIWAAMGASSAVSIFGMYVVTQLAGR